MTQSLFVPACGDRLVLAEPWNFKCYAEHRNMNFLRSLGLVPKDNKSWNLYADPNYQSSRNYNLKEFLVTLPAGTMLECDRVYIRAFSKTSDENDYDSITWKVVEDGKAKLKSRFWAKLADCNHIIFTNVSTYKERKKAP